MREFRLKRVLRLRTQLREQAEDALGRTRATLAAVRERIATTRAAEDAARTGEATALSHGATAAVVQRFRAYERRLATYRAGLENESTVLATEVQRQREQLLERRREERQLEKLEVRARERGVAEDERATMVLLDDLALRQRGARR
jgi:flagellar export protein FliJ